MTGVHNDQKRERLPRSSPQEGGPASPRRRKGRQSQVTEQGTAPTVPPADVLGEGDEIELGCWSPRLA